MRKLRIPGGFKFVPEEDEPEEMFLDYLKKQGEHIPLEEVDVEEDDGCLKVRGKGYKREDDVPF